VNSYYPPWIGGAESYSKNLTTALVSLGNSVTIYCSERPLRFGMSLDGDTKIIRMRTPLMFYGTPIVIFPHSFFTEDYDVIHANFPSPYLASISGFTSKLRKMPSVLTWHNDLPPVTSSAAILVNLHNKLSPAYLANYDVIIATTSAYARKSEILRRVSRKVEVVNNGVDTKRFNPKARGERIRDLHNLKDTKVALFVGALTTFHAYKGVDVLLRAFSLASKQCTNVRLLVVGGGNLLESYKRQAIELGISDLVLFAGFIDDAILPEYYAACDFAVLPSKDSSEGFGLVLLEAMACGKAVIGSKAGGIVDVISSGENGILVPPLDAGRLSEAMILLFQNDILREKLAESGLEFARLHDWSLVAKRVEEIYNRIRA